MELAFLKAQINHDRRHGGLPRADHAPVLRRQ
jgi:hypothetical protein